MKWQLMILLMSTGSLYAAIAPPSAVVEGSGVRLSWTTNSIQPNCGWFQIQNTSDGQVWSAVSANLRSNTVTYYHSSYTPVSTTLYRLRELTVDQASVLYTTLGVGVTGVSESPQDEQRTWFIVLNFAVAFATGVLLLGVCIMAVGL